MSLALAVDVGTQSLKICVVDRQYAILETARVAYAPQVKSKTQVEIDAEDLWRAFVQALGRLQRAREATVIGFSTLCPSLLPMDATGTPLAPVILHLDRRSHAQARWALAQVGEEHFLQVAGNLPIPGGISLTSLLWMRDNRPDVYNRRDVTFGHVNTFFMKRLVDRFLIDPSNASFTGLYDTVGYTDWDAGLLQALHVERRLLPEVVMSATVVGELGRRAAAATGLRPGTPVVMGANDTTCATVGADVTRPGMLMNTSGTVEIMVLCLDHPLADKDHLLRTHAYPQRWLAMRTVGAGGASLEWFRGTFCREMTREAFYGRYLVEVLAPDRRPEARFLPYLSGDRHRIRQKSGAFTGLSLSTTREDFLLALAEGIVSFQAEGLHQWRKTVPLDPHICHVGGGASEAYTQYKQRRLKGFKFLQMGETAVLGAARLAFEAFEGAPPIEAPPR
jgi:sugar (pentulose or hexulose) kinase